MGVERAEPAAAAPVEEGVVADLVEFLGLEDLEAADAGAAAGGEIDGGFFLFEQAGAVERAGEGVGGVEVVAEGGAEIDGFGQHRGRLAVLEHRLAVVFAQAGGVGFHADIDRLGIGILDEDEGEGADIGGHIGVAAPAAVGVEEQVVALAEAEQRDRRRVRSAGEHDRIMLGDDLELAEPDGDRLGALAEAVADAAIEPEMAMQPRIDADHTTEELRHRRLGGRGGGGGREGGIGHRAHFLIDNGGGNLPEWGPSVEGCVRAGVYPAIVRSSSSSAAAAKARMLASRSLLPVSSVREASRGPVTARAAWPAASP